MQGGIGWFIRSGGFFRRDEIAKLARTMVHGQENDHVPESETRLLIFGQTGVTVWFLGGNIELGGQETYSLTMSFGLLYLFVLKH